MNHAGSRTISRIDAAILREAARRGQGTLSLADDQAWLQRHTPNPKLQLSRMAKRGSIARVAPGRYVILPAGADTARQVQSPGLLLAAAIPSRVDYYLGFLSALIDHGLTDESSEVIHLAVRGASPPRLDELVGRPVQITRITQQHRWFGVERVRALGRSFYFRSDVERTLLDTLDRPALCGETDTWVRAWDRAFTQAKVDVERLIDYAGNHSRVVAARCAFWLRELGRVREARLLGRGIRLSGVNLLDPSDPFGPGPWPRDRDTGLTVNIPEQMIVGWLEYGK